MAAFRSDADAQLWAAVRGFSDAELRGVQASILAFHCADTSALLSRSKASDVAIQVQLGDEAAQRVRVDDLVHVFLDFLHRQVQLHADARVSGDAAQESHSISMATPDTNMATAATFEDEFPQWPVQRATPNAGAKVTKRRITTTLLTPKDATVVARPVPVAIAFPPLGASESTRPPAWAKRSLLEKRMGAASPSSSSSNASAPSAWGPPKSAVNKAPMAWGVAMSQDVKTKKEEPVVTRVAPKKKMSVEDFTQPQQVPVRKKPTSNQATHLQQEQKSSMKMGSNQDQGDAAASTMPRKTSSEMATKSVRSSAAFAVNTQAAKLYGFLIKERLVTNTCAELQVLISLLYRADCTSCSSAESQVEPSGDCGENGSETPCGAASEFCWRTHCLDFAEIVFQEIEPVLAHLGADLLGLVKLSLREAEGICQDLLERLDRESVRREELRVAESARVGCQLPVEMKASAVRDFALPFNEETDSRLHYRTPAESLLYTNREKVRDGFLSLLRQFQQKQHSLVGIENAGVAAAAIAAARELLAGVSPENRWWFAKFFVQELVQVGSNPFGESDEDLVLKIMEDKLVVKNPDRLRKLHRRFSSQKPLNKTPQPHLQRSGGGNRASAKGASNSLRKNRPEVRTTTSEDDATKNFTATLDRMKSYFTDNQLFFFHFLHSCDSYEFSELVKHQLERQFYAIRETIPPSTDARKEFTEVVLRLKVVAKFLGYLRFSPQWQVTSSIRGLSAQNAAFKAVEREGISTLEMARDSSLDVKKLLETSILHASISKCIPWLCDYLSMLSLDRLSMGTTYFKQLVVLLQLLYRSPRLNSLGETGLYIAMQTERIFHVLRLDGGFLHGSDYQSKALLPSAEIRDALAREDEDSPEEAGVGTGEDHLPFLYSQVFVQSCVSALDDLRGFIQTRAHPTPRRKLSIGSGSVGAGQPVAPIRKLRPLQVVIEDEHSSESISSFAAKQEHVAHAATLGCLKLPTTGLPPNFPPVQEENDKLSEAVFKVHPKLKVVVDFVVGTVTTDVCEHVVAHVVTPRADILIDLCASESGLLTVGKDTAPALGEDAAFAARASFQMLITSKTRHEANATVVVALAEALRLGEKRVRAAVPPFMPPSSHPTLTNSVVFVALQRMGGALKTLVPKSSQTEFVKRVAFRNKSLLKDLGPASKGAAAAPSSSTTTPATAPQSVVNNQEDPQPTRTEQRYRELRRLAAEIATSTSQQGQKNSSLAKWETQATTLSQCLSHFINSFNESVAAGDLRRDAASPLSFSALVLWDIVWRAITSSLKFLGSSLGVFAECELLSMKEDRVEAVEKAFVEFVARFAAALEAIVLSIDGNDFGGDVAVFRLQSMLEFVVDGVLQLPLKLVTSKSEGDLLVKRFAVRASSLVVATLRVAVKPEKADERQVTLNWDQWVQPRDPSSVESVQAQFRRDVWAASTAAATAM
ncbi:hypothetical protein PHYPSEUDO_002788 [Phytophthora pseudosyringae]|uniref:Uncharacterized protein n=1 Tax=Phytophthora pseudosyringae TaxID=221518 RepID=A0A8T1VWJ6_9STRA|nr:hypothetical protein PHYPSEUDO_002788 [Phytophthora pseudosyringae]